MKTSNQAMREILSIAERTPVFGRPIEDRAAAYAGALLKIQRIAAEQIAADADNAARLERLAELVNRARMGGIDSDATLEECIEWIHTGRTIAEQRR